MEPMVIFLAVFFFLLLLETMRDSFSLFKKVDRLEQEIRELREKPKEN